MAPHCEWPQTTTSSTPSVSTANSNRGGRRVRGARRGVGRHDVADVFHDEQITGFALCDQLGQHAGIRTRDEKRVGILPFAGEPLEELGVVAELVRLKLWMPSMSRCTPHRERDYGLAQG